MKEVSIDITINCNYLTKLKEANRMMVVNFLFLIDQGKTNEQVHFEKVVDIIQQCLQSAFTMDETCPHYNITVSSL